MEKIRTHSPYGKGFALLPWAEHFRDGRMPTIPDSWIAVLPVIIAHANANREAWPGYARICALASVSRSTLHEAIDGLVRSGWIYQYTRNAGKISHNVYRLIYGNKADSRRWIALHHDIIFSGVWAMMRPSDRKVYLMLRAFGWRGGHSMAADFVACDIDMLGEPYASICRDSNFLPAHIYDPTVFQQLSGMKARTYRASFAWLLSNRLVIAVGEKNDMQEGLLMPFRPGRYAPDIKERLMLAKTASRGKMEASSGAKRSLSFARRRQSRDSAAPASSKRMLATDAPAPGDDKTL